MTTPGEVGLKVNSPEGITLFADRVITLDARLTTTPLTLPRGVHTINVLLKPKKRRQDLRLDLVDVPDSPARSQLVGGK